MQWQEDVNVLTFTSFCLTWMSVKVLIHQANLDQDELGQPHLYL